MKNKKFLLSFIAVSMAAASLSVFAIVNSKKAEIFNSMKQAVADHEFDVDMTTIQSTGDEGVYQAVAVGSGENTVNTKFVGITPTETGFSVAANSTAYITNIDSIRGIASFKACYSGDAKIICYGSSNVLTIENIFSGKYQDLAYADGGSYEEGYQYSLKPSQNANSFANCHYVLAFIINQSNDPINFSKVLFEAVCAAEPETQEIGTYSDFTAAEKAKFVTYEVPNDFPFPGSGSYTLDFGAGQFQVAMNCLLNNSNYGALMNSIQASGYNVNTPAIGPVDNPDDKFMGVGIQRKRGDIVDTLLLTISYPVNGYFYTQVAYSNQMDEIGGATEWPTDEINAKFPGMASYFVPLQLSDAKYSIMMAEESGGKRDIYMYITVSDFAAATLEVNAYLAGLDSATYTVNGYEVNHFDGRHKMTIHGEESSNMFAVQLTELVIYDSFPFDQLLPYASVELFPKESSMDAIPGKYSINSSDVTAIEFDVSDLESLIGNLEAKGFYHLGNSTNGMIKAKINGDMEYYGVLQYHKISSSSYLFRTDYYNCDNDNDSLVGAYQRTSDYEAYTLFAEVLDYSGDFKIVSDGNLFVISLVDGTYSDYEAMYAAINQDKVAYKENFASRHSFSFAVETEYSSEGNEEYENFDLFFTETTSGLDIEIVAQHHHTGSPTFDHEIIGTYANQTNALSEIATGAYGSPLAVPAGNNYLIGPTNSIEYVATAEETRNIANSYAETLLNNGYHYEIGPNMFVSPNENHPNVRMFDNRYPGKLTIEFTKDSYSSPLVNYSDLSSETKTFLAHFPSINVEGGKYAALANDNELTLYFDTTNVIPFAYLLDLSDDGFVSDYSGDKVLSPYATLVKIDNDYNFYKVEYIFNTSLVFDYKFGVQKLVFTYEAAKFKPADSTYFDDSFYDYVVLPQNGYIALYNLKDPSSKSNSYLLLGDKSEFVTYLVSLGFVSQGGGYRMVKIETIDEVEYYTTVDFTSRSLYTECHFQHGINGGGGKD